MTVRAASIPLDMFTDIIAVHWPDNIITKLDFVGNKYMVRGKIQELTDVLGGPLPEYEAEQQGWRTADGLDLRHFGHVYGELDGSKTAWLKNKVYPPTKNNPGALNEFLFADGTFVIEWDWGDVYTSINQFGGFPDGWDVYWSLFRSNDTYGEGNEWQVGTNEYVMRVDPGGYGWVGQWYWEFTEISPFGGVGVPGVFSATFRTQGTVTSDFGGALPPGPYSIQADPDDHLVYIFRSGSPAPEYGTYFGEIPQRDILAPAAEVGTYERTGHASFRTVGMEPRFYSPTFVPIATGDLPAPYGRNRLAMNIDGKLMATSINGGPVRQTETDTILLNRKPRVVDGKRLLYFDEPLLEGTGADDTLFPRWQVSMQIPGIIRCIWWYRLPRKKWNFPRTADDVLRPLSTVRALTPPDSPKWKTT